MYNTNTIVLDDYFLVVVVLHVKRFPGEFSLTWVYHDLRRIPV